MSYRTTDASKDTRAAALLTHTPHSGLVIRVFTCLIFIVHMSITTPNTYLVSPSSNQVGSFLHKKKQKKQPQEIKSQIRRSVLSSASPRTVFEYKTQRRVIAIHILSAFNLNVDFIPRSRLACKG